MTFPVVIFFTLFHHIQKIVDENLVFISFTTKEAALFSCKRVMWQLLIPLHFLSQTKSKTKRADSKPGNIPPPNYCHHVFWTLSHFNAMAPVPTCWVLIIQNAWAVLPRAAVFISSFTTLRKDSLALSSLFALASLPLPLLVVIQIPLLPCVSSGVLPSLVWGCLTKQAEN